MKNKINIVALLLALFFSQTTSAAGVIIKGASCVSVTAPDQVNIGSTFSAAIVMQNTSTVNPWNIEGDSKDLLALGQTIRKWYSVSIDSSNHDVYATVLGLPDGNIYKQTGGTGNFVSLGQTVKDWYGVAVDSSNHNVYATVSNGDIYKQTGGVGNFIGLGQTVRNWTGIAVDSSNHNVYATVSNGDIYKQTGGVGNFIGLGQTVRKWNGITVDSTNQNVYATVFGGDIYKQTGGAGNFVGLGQGPVVAWTSISVDSSNQNVYATVGGATGNVYKQTAGAGNFVSLGQTVRNWLGIAVDPSNQNVYAAVPSSDIYKQDPLNFYHLGSQNPQDNVRWGLSRVPLPTYTSPGATATFNFTATAPSTVGIYAFDWKMIEKNVEWFGNTCTKTINVVNLPDLTAGAVSPIGPFIADNVQNLSATVSNIGTIPTGTNFSNFFQVATEEDGEGTITDKSPSTMSALAVGGNSVASVSHTFTSVGTYSVRVCADKSNRNDSGTITEVDEDNNCGDWTNVTVNPASTANIKANGSDGPIDIAYNGTVDVTWVSTNADSCAVIPPNWTELNSSAGTHVLNLIESIIYTLSCLPAGANSVDTVTVNVLSQPKDLNIIKSGQGTVTSIPAGINCGSGCQSQTVSFPPDADVELFVAVTPGRIFTGWSGDCSGRDTCVVNMNNPKTIIINFAAKPKYKDF